MPNNYNSSFTGQHNDEYDTRITALQNIINDKLAKINIASDGIVFFGRISYDTLSGSTVNSTYFSDLLKYLCTTYPNKINTLFIGIAHPNSQGLCMINIYNTSAVTDGLPQYSSGFYIGLSAAANPGWSEQFGTNSYTYYHKQTERKNYGIKKWGNTTLNASTTSTSQSISITTTGRPIFLLLTGDINPMASESTWITASITRGSTKLTEQVCQSNASSCNNPFSVSYLDAVGAGSYTYTATIQRGGGTSNLSENGNGTHSPQFIAFEI